MTLAKGPTLGTEVLTSIDQLERIAGPWKRLWQECRWASPFQCPEWLLPWCRCWPAEGFRALALWQDDSLVGLASWRIDIDDFGQRRGMLIGAGLSDYLDVLVSPAWESVGAAAILAQLAELRSELDLCELSQLAPESFLARTLRGNGFAELARPAVACPVLQMSSGGGASGGGRGLSDCLPPAQDEKLRYYRRRLGRSGVAQYEPVDEANFDAVFTTLIRLHTRRWRDREQPGVLADPSVERFHREAARHMLHSGLLRQYALRLEGQIIAVYYGFHAHGRSYYYLSGFDPECRQLSPGMLVVGYAIEQALREGAREFDFLRGQESYKYAWGARDEPTYCWRFSRNG